jgi:hypothetical protein
MAEKSQIAIYISLGSLVISSLSFLYAIHQAKVNRRIEKARAYDKVYHDASDLLLFHYKNEQEKPYESSDKDLEKAVNEYTNAHWLEQTYGFNMHLPISAKTDIEKANFSSKVTEEYYKHQDKKQNEFWDEFINYQSPVFHLGNEEFSERFTRLMSHVTENLSSFSPVIVDSWEKMRLLTPEKVKQEYLAVKRVNKNACETIEETIEDPYLHMLLSIRHEYREINKTLLTQWSEFWFKWSMLPYRCKRVLNKLFKRDK